MRQPFTGRYTTYQSLNRTHRGKPVKDLVNSKEWKKFLTDGLDSLQYNIAVIPVSMENRADLIARASYGSEKLWWLICSANGIIDPTTELVAGKQIKIPIIR